MPYDPDRDPLSGLSASLSSPARLIRQVTPSDAADLNPYAKALYVFVPEDVAGGVGTVRITAAGAVDEDHVDIKTLPGLQPLPPCQVRKVWASGTSAGLIVYALADR